MLGPPFPRSASRSAAEAEAICRDWYQRHGAAVYTYLRFQVAEVEVKAPAIRETTARLTTTRHCCADFDGGGYADDGLLVIGVPPDRVVMAAIYERPREAGQQPAPAQGWPLR